MALLQAEDFEPHVGKLFRFEDGSHTLRLERIEVHAGELPDDVPRAPFTLSFSGPKPGAVMAEGLHSCEAEDGVAFELYVSPIHTPDPGRQDYQAVFN